MPLIRRVLDESPCLDLSEYIMRGGGRGLDVARGLGPDGVIDQIEAAGLRGRGGAGFPTGKKWRTIADSRSSVASTSVVINGAEGEPGTFKDRALLRCNPYKVIEGALIAAVAVEASDVIVCLKRSFEREVVDVARAIGEVEDAGWVRHLRLRVVEGPSSYLFGEETALLEVVEARQPFPRLDPPFRRGVDPHHTYAGHSASRVHLAGLGGTDSPPALVNNVETMANVTGILRNGADWYRSIGTDASPGSLVCTITGQTRRHGVGEVPMGTTLREAIALIGGGPRKGREVLAVLSGVANPIIPAELLDTPLCFEEMARVGSGLGAGGFIVFQDQTNMLAVAQGVARFLAIESCGQCEPCKRDGLAIAKHLGVVARSQATERDVRALYGRLDTVTRGARCSLASQQEDVTRSILGLFAAENPLESLAGDGIDEATLILPLVDIVGGRAVLDTSHLSKQPDWTHAAQDSGSWPAARLGNQPIVIEPPAIREELSSSRMDAVATAARPPDQAPFPILLSVHRDLLAMVDAVALAEPANRPELISALGDRLRAHIDVTQRVLYPMVRRVAGADGDAASWGAENAERAGLRILDLLARSSGDATESDAAVRHLVEEVRSHIEAEQHRVIPLLQDNMPVEDLDALAEALSEARLTAQPPRHAAPPTNHASEAHRAPAPQEAM